MGNRTPQAAKAAKKRGKAIRSKLVAARKDGYTAGHAAGYKDGHAAGWIEGSRATLRQLYKNSDRTMAVYLGQISMRREFTSTDPVEIEARRIVIGRAQEFEDRVILGMKTAKPMPGKLLP